MIRYAVAFGIAGLTILGVMATGTTGSQIYRNEQFGIVLPVPDGTVLCPQLTGLDHGPVILLGNSDVKSCMNPDHRSIGVFAGYNAADVTKHLADYMKWECENAEKRPCEQPPSDLKVPGLHSMAARVNDPNGRIEILVVTQAGKPDPDFDPTVPSVNYDLRLRTRSEHMEADLTVFRHVLQTIRLSPPS